jgi:hypothetical protein
MVHRRFVAAVTPQGAAGLRRALRGEALHGEALRGEALRGGALRGEALRDEALRGGALRGGALRGGAFPAAGSRAGTLRGLRAVHGASRAEEPS